MYLRTAAILCTITTSFLLARIVSSDDSSDSKIKPITGRMRTSDDSHCTWFEVKSGLTETSLGMACFCRNAAGRKQGYNCQYTGELQGCPEYNTNRNQFFTELTAKLAGIYIYECRHCELIQSGCMEQSIFSPTKIINVQRTHTHTHTHTRTHSPLRTENYSNACDPTIEAIMSDKCPDALLRKKDIQTLESPCVPEEEVTTKHQEL